MMTPMERIGSLMMGKIPDRVPIIINLFEQGARELNMNIEDYYKSGENVARGQIALHKKFGTDTVWSMFYAAQEARFFGAKKFIFSKEGPPNLGELVIKKWDDIEKLKVPEDVFEHEEFQELKKCIGILNNEFNGTVPVLAPITNSLTLPILLMGFDKWLELLLTGPEDLKQLMIAKCSEFLKNEIAAFRKAGIHIQAYISSACTTDIITRDLFLKYGLPSIMKDFENVDTGGIVYFNGGGKINPTLNDIIENTKLKAFYINPRESAKEAKEIINGRGLLVGVINDIELMRWNREEIDSQVKDLIMQGKDGGGYMIGTLMMPYLIPEKNIFHLIESAKKWGDYSLK